MVTKTIPRMASANKKTVSSSQTSNFQKPARMAVPGLGKKSEKFQKVAKMSGLKAAFADKQKANIWYQQTASKLKSLTPNKALADKDNLMKNVRIGSMFMFFYDPKWKNTLPFYDTFPLIFPIEMYKDGFLGLNLHYLPPLLRGKLMDALYDLINNDKMNDTTRLKISYDLLNGASRFKWFKPCIHRYLFSHVQSRFLYIDPVNWDKAVMLPLERFRKATKEQVWKNSRRKV